MQGHYSWDCSRKWWWTMAAKYFVAREVGFDVQGTKICYFAVSHSWRASLSHISLSFWKCQLKGMSTSLLARLYIKQFFEPQNQPKKAHKNTQKIGSYQTWPKVRWTIPLRSNLPHLNQQWWRWSHSIQHQIQRPTDSPALDHISLAGPPSIVVHVCNTLEHSRYRFQYNWVLRQKVWLILTYEHARSILPFGVLED